MNTIATNPFMIGWDNLFPRFEELTRVNANTFPAYNIIELEDEDHFMIELALAGYKKDDLEVIEKDGELIIKGEKKDLESKYLHKGIAGRKFTRVFSLADHIRVSGSELKDGMLYVILVREIPEEKKPKVISIKSS
jgi:molecular chaperone IbpA